MKNIESKRKKWYSKHNAMIKRRKFHNVDLRC